MSHIHLVFAPVLILAAVGASILCGCHPGFECRCFQVSPEKKADWIVKKVSKELNLKQDQKEKLVQIKEELLAKHKEFMSPHEKLLNAFLTEAVKDTVDQKILNRSVEETHQQMEGMRPFLISKFVKFHAMLTLEQRVKLAEKIRQFHQKSEN
jgi:protein CpxP